MEGAGRITPNWVASPTLEKINQDMKDCIGLSETQFLEIRKHNARYLAEVQNILTFEFGQEKNKALMVAWDKWLDTLETELTLHQYNFFFSWNHEKLWQGQVGQM